HTHTRTHIFLSEWGGESKGGGGARMVKGGQFPSLENMATTTLLSPSGVVNNSLDEALGMAGNVNASPDSKEAVRLALRNRFGDFVLSGVFGQAFPGYVERGIARFYNEARKGQYDDVTGIKVPRRYGLGDIYSLVNPRASKVEDQWALARLQEALPVSHSATLGAQLERFYRLYLAPHVIDLEQWTRADTAMIIFLLYSFENPMPRIHTWFKDRLGAGVECGLQRYQLDLCASQDAGALDRLPFEPMLVMELIRVMARPNGETYRR
ncbi:MAG: hypothetical protein LC650_01170, partial [Actinobacteria bacterium]|nr:hypothetical protein [Actinomycetota bacterium]